MTTTGTASGAATAAAEPWQIRLYRRSIKKKETLEAVKYVRALYKETMTPEVFTWDPSANNRGILAGKLSFVCNAISVTRTAEKDNPEMSQKIFVSPTLKGPVRRLAAEHVMDCYVVWDFAENKEGAKKFLDQIKVERLGV